MSTVEAQHVDCEVHAIVRTIDDLVPYVTSAWAQRFRNSEFRLPSAGLHPGIHLEAIELNDRDFDPRAAAERLGEDVGTAIVLPAQAFVTAGWLGHEMAAAFVSALNDYVIDRWLPVDPRFRFAIAVAAHDGVVAAEEIRRLGSHPGAVAVCLAPIGVNMGHPHYRPIYDAAEALGLPVIVHPSGVEGTTEGAPALAGGGPRTPEETFAMLPQVAAANAGSLIFNGIFVDYPRLKVVFAGFGFEWVPPWPWRVDAEWRGLRTEVPWLERSPSHYLAEHVSFVVDGAAGASGTLTNAFAAMMPMESLLWGSDFPFGERAVDAMGSEIPQQLTRGQMADNAQRVFGRSTTGSGGVVREDE